MSTSMLPASTHAAPTPGHIALSAACGLCGFLTVFGAAHLALIQITKPSGYVFFGTLAVVPPLVALGLARFTPFGRGAWQRFAFGAAMCALAIPCIYLARFFPTDMQAMVRNILGLPFFALALVGPKVIRRIFRRRPIAEV